MAPFEKGVPESHFNAGHLPKYPLPKIVAVTAVEFSGPGEFNYSKKVWRKCCLADRLLQLNQTALPCCRQLKNPPSQESAFQEWMNRGKKALLNLLDCLLQVWMGSFILKVTQDRQSWDQNNGLIISIYTLKSTVYTSTKRSFKRSFIGHYRVLFL